MYNQGQIIAGLILFMIALAFLILWSAGNAHFQRERADRRAELFSHRRKRAKPRSVVSPSPPTTGLTPSKKRSILRALNALERQSSTPTISGIRMTGGCRNCHNSRRSTCSGCGLCWACRGGHPSGKCR